MSTSKLSKTFQTTIPEEIRQRLKLQAGDEISFQILDHGLVIMKKEQPLDKQYLQALNKTLAEWESELDEQAYEHLQNL